MIKTRIAVTLLLASSATPSLAHPHSIASYEPYHRRPVERVVDRNNTWSRGHTTPKAWHSDHDLETRVSDPDTNSCIEGSVIGGLLGAGLGAVLSRGDGRWIGVPVGGATGALLGCQVDGG
ncbi:MAG: glycine zipper 2TM domain-containing protein [Synechococcus sp.]